MLLSEMPRSSLEELAEYALNRIVELEEQLEASERERRALRDAAEQIVPSGNFTLIGPYEYVRSDEIIALRDALRVNESNPASEPPVSSRGGTPLVSSSVPPAPNPAKDSDA